MAESVSSCCALSLAFSLPLSVIVFKEKEGWREEGLKKIPGEQCHCSYACGSYNVELLPQYIAFSPSPSKEF